MTTEELKQEIRNAYKEGFDKSSDAGLKYFANPVDGYPNWEYEYIESRAHAVATGRWTKSNGVIQVASVAFNGEKVNPL